MSLKITVPVLAKDNLNIADHTKVLVVKALNRHKNNRKATANALGISERTLYRLIEKYKKEQ